MFLQVLLLIAPAVACTLALDPTIHLHINSNPKLKNVDGSLAARYHDGCLQEHFIDQPVDHFNFHEQGTIQQRYFTCSKYHKAGGPVFFYSGNQHDVTLYINTTGLMWEHAEEFQAFVVFAQHRDQAGDPTHLTAEQALADYARLAYDIKQKLGPQGSPVIAFGGAYGGSLAAWLRMKYPTLFQGAVAASAPVGAFPGSAGFQPGRFWEAATRGAAAAAAPGCPDRVRAAFRALLGLSRDAIGRAQLSELLRLCDPLDTEDDALTAALWLRGSFHAFASGSYPYPSSYITGDPSHPLPPWPMQEACRRVASHQPATMPHLVEDLREAAGLLYNASGSLRCFELQSSVPSGRSELSYQFCTALHPLLDLEQRYYPSNGEADMFWDQGPAAAGFDLEAIGRRCRAAWNVTPRVHHAVIQFGGVEAAAAASNIVFSSGWLDPWSVFSVTANSSSSPSVLALVMPNGGTHADLMFSHAEDTPDVTATRQAELAAVRGWVQQYKAPTGS